VSGDGVSLPDPKSIAHLVATHIVRSSTRGVQPSAVDLADAISEVTLQTQMLGASLLTVTLIDPQWDIVTSGFLDVNDEGLLDELEVNFPEGSSSWWRLAMLEVHCDASSPNLVLTFEDRIVSYLRDRWRPKVITPRATTRAQFVKQLVDEVGRGDGLQRIKFVCPSVNVRQPIATTPSTGVVVTPAKAKEKARKANKGRGVGRGAKVTAKGVPLTPHQIDEANALLDVASGLNAGTVAMTALICAAIGESNLGAQPGAYVPNRAGYWGVLQGGSGQKGSAPNFPDPHDTAGMAHAFLVGGKGFQAGGAIKLARTGVGVQNLEPGAIATMVEASGQPASFYETYLHEAWAIIAAYGGGTLGSQIPATANPPKPVNDVSQLQRGTPGNPDENSWDCIQRLASDVHWYAFSNADTLYYLEGPDLMAQHPAAYVSRVPEKTGLGWALTDGYSGTRSVGVVLAPTPSVTYDNTQFVYRSTHVRKGKVVHRSRLAKPQTPSEIQLNVICEIGYLPAGDVVVFHDAGPLNGRWVVADNTRNCLGDTFSQLTLAPPQAPTPEPQADASKAMTMKARRRAGGSAGPAADPSIINVGRLTGVVEAAQKALAQKSKYRYSEGADRGNNGTLFGPAPRTMDCSAFVTLCYKAAGLPDPNHLGYGPIGTTFSFFPHCMKIQNPQPGDLCFFGTAPKAGSTLHMSIYIGNGQVINMGGPGEPAQGPAKEMGPGASLFLGYYRSDVAPPATIDERLAADPTNVLDR
jgi:cell wall-associated NlpC family hydrolase